MRNVICVLICLLFVSLAPAAGNRCDIFGRISEVGLNDNNAFWEEFAKINNRGQPSNSQIEKLIEKYAGKGEVKPFVNVAAETKSNASTHTPKAHLAGTQKVEITHNADKGYTKAPAQVQHKADELVALFNEKGRAAIQDLKSHNWNYEYIGNLKKYSVRLNGGYRAMITVEGDSLKIWEISNQPYRH